MALLRLHWLNGIIGSIKALLRLSCRMRTQRYSEHEDVYSDLLTGEPGSGTPACGEQDFFLVEFVGVKCDVGSGSA